MPPLLGIETGRQQTVRISATVSPSGAADRSRLVLERILLGGGIQNLGQLSNQNQAFVANPSFNEASPGQIELRIVAQSTTPSLAASTGLVSKLFFIQVQSVQPAFTIRITGVQPESIAVNSPGHVTVSAVVNNSSNAPPNLTALTQVPTGQEQIVGTLQQQNGGTYSGSVAIAQQTPEERDATCGRPAVAYIFIHTSVASYSN